jgi:hypothetical protein
MDSVLTNGNFGTNPSYWISATNRPALPPHEVRYLFDFDLGRIPSALVLNAASLRITVRTGVRAPSPVANAVSFYPVLRAWTETTAIVGTNTNRGVSWLERSEGNAWSANGCSGIGIDRGTNAIARMDAPAAGTGAATNVVGLVLSLAQAWLDNRAGRHGLLAVAERTNTLFSLLAGAATSLLLSYEERLPPGPIVDLDVVTGVRSGTVQFRFTTPGAASNYPWDNGGGRYEVRYRTLGIVVSTQFFNAAPVSQSWPVAPKGTRVTNDVFVTNYGQSFFFSARAYDEDTNLSPMPSPVPSVYAMVADVTQSVRLSFFQAGAERPMHDGAVVLSNTDTTIRASVARPIPDTAILLDFSRNRSHFELQDTMNAAQTGDVYEVTFPYDEAKYSRGDVWYILPMFGSQYYYRTHGGAPWRIVFDWTDIAAGVQNSPFNPSAGEVLRILAESDAPFVVFDLSGRQVATVEPEREFPDGGWFFAWDGMGPDGEKPLPSGAYVLVQSDDVRHVIVLKGTGR